MKKHNDLKREYEQAIRNNINFDPVKLLEAYRSLMRRNQKLHSFTRQIKMKCLMWKDKCLSNLDARWCVCKGRYERLTTELEETNEEVDSLRSSLARLRSIEDKVLKFKNKNADLKNKY